MEKESTIYEISYLLFSSIVSEQVRIKAGELKDMLKSSDAEIISDEDPVFIDLAYSMLKVIGATRHKIASAYFGWVKFEISKDGMEKVKKALDFDDDIVRYLIIKTVRENTFIGGNTKLAKKDRTRKEENLTFEESQEAEIPKEILSSDEEIDKSINDLVVTL